MSRPEPLKTHVLMRPGALVYLYRRRLRMHAAQELFAGIGIAIAVALVFATMVAESSIAGAGGEVVRAVTGPASLQLRARGGAGLPEGLLARVERLPGVRQAAPLLEQTATVRSAGGRHTAIDLAGTDTSLAVLDGLGETLPLAALRPGTIGLSRASAEAIGIPAEPGLSNRSAPDGGLGGARYVTLQMRGRASSLRVSTVLGPEAVGALSHALVAVMPLARMQQLAGLPAQITRIFVEATPGAQARVRSELGALADGRLEVAPANQDVALLRQALGPSALASGLFAAIGALLGFLFAFNAMLLTVPERRQAIAELRLSGARRAGIVQMVLFEALCLGVAASLVGLAGGYALSVGVFHQSSAYLAEAFTLGSSTIVSARALLLAFFGGLAATCVASTVVLLDLRRGRARDAVYRQEGVAGDALGSSIQLRLFAGALSLIVGAGVLYALFPRAAIAAVALLALGTVLAVPLAFAGVLALARALSERYERLIALPVALASLRTTTLRSLALAATGAVALFGSVALGGSRENLLRGIGSFAHSYVAAANVWVTNPGDNQAVDEFSAGGDPARIAKVPGVAGVSAFHGGFLTLGDRRVWLIARPPSASRQVLESEIDQGNAAGAVARLGEGGWIAVSERIAEEHHTGVGGSLTLPTPSGDVRLRIAATTTNLAWPPGVIFMSAADYSRLWAASAPTALAVALRPGADPASVRDAIARTLSGLEVATAATREASIDALTSEGLGQLREISTLLLAAAIAAMAAALASSLWQRREWLSGLRLSGASPARLRRILLLEAALMLGAGCLTGALAGIYGEVVIDGYLRQVTGFPLASVLSGGRSLEVFALVLALALAIMAIPGWLASGVSPGLALEND
ncbi:MAG TPA: ABC transporter permease [Solirubrobacteraceae bacterium]|nr:ABC transporter permease [Solirubrobacteraceae bacterium]